MMKYDFETCIDKRNSGSVKWRDMLEKQPDVPEGVVPLSVADMEFKTAPEITAGLKEYIETQALGYTEATDTYYDAVAGWMKDRHGWDVKREWIVTTPGIVLALGLAVRAFTQPGRRRHHHDARLLSFLYGGGKAGQENLRKMNLKTVRAAMKSTLTASRKKRKTRTIECSCCAARITRSAACGPGKSLPA